MEANKVYQDVVVLLYNVLKNEKLRYELYKDDKYRELYIMLVNDLLTLEREQNIEYKEKKWANVFGKAIVITSQAKQRFEKQDGKTVAKIYEDYSKMIGYSMNAFEVNRDSLTTTTIDFNEDDVLYDAKLADDVIKKYDALAEQAEKEKNTEDNPEIFVNENKKVQDSDQQAYNGGQNGFYGQPNGQSFMDMANNMPKPPMADPRFYPYNGKPTWMKWAKYALGVVVIITAILLIVASAYANSKTFTFSGIVGSWTVTLSDNTQKALADTGKWNLAAQQSTTFMSVIIYIFYAIPSIYIAWNCFSKPRNMSQKYRVSYWPIIFMIVFFALSIIDIYQFAAVNEIKSNIQSLIQKPVGESWNQDVFNNWFDEMKATENIKAVTVLMDVAIGFLGFSIIFGIIMLILNPKLNRQKLAKAQNEYQKAMMSMMQGVPYTMDPSLYEDNDDVIIRNKTKFGLWLEKVGHKMMFWKRSNKDNSKNKD